MSAQGMEDLPGLFRERLELDPDTNSGAGRTASGQRMELAASRVDHGKTHSYFYGRDMVSGDNYIVMGRRGMSIEQAIEQGQQIQVPRGQNVDEFLQRAELASRAQVPDARVGAVAASVEMRTRSQIADVIDRAGGESVYLEGMYRRLAPQADTTSVGALRSGADGHADMHVNVNTGSRANGPAVQATGMAERMAGMRAHGLKGVFGLAAVGLAYEVGGPRAAAAATIESIVPGGEMITAATGLSDETNIAVAGLNSARAAAGATAGAAIGQAVIPIPVVGAVIGGGVGAAVTTLGIDEMMERSGINQSARENRTEAQRQQDTIQQIRGMSPEEIAAAPPGIRENLQAMREAIDVRDQAQARLDGVTGGPATGRVQQITAAHNGLWGAESRLTTLYDDIAMDAEGQGERMQAFLRERQLSATGPEATPVQVPETPQIVQRQPVAASPAMS